MTDNYQRGLPSSIMLDDQFLCDARRLGWKAEDLREILRAAVAGELKKRDMEAAIAEGAKVHLRNS